MVRQINQTFTKALGSYLASLRVAKGLTLRQVEEATDNGVSNAYLSQLEHERIAKPSPNVLYSLARVYGVAYEQLMERAGYVVAKETSQDNEKPERVTTFAIDNLSTEEEEELLHYLAYIRTKKRKFYKNK